MNKTAMVMAIAMGLSFGTVQAAEIDDLTLQVVDSNDPADMVNEIELPDVEKAAVDDGRVEQDSRDGMEQDSPDAMEQEAEDNKGDVSSEMENEIEDTKQQVEDQVDDTQDEVEDVQNEAIDESQDAESDASD